MTDDKTVKSILEKLIENIAVNGLKQYEEIDNRKNCFIRQIDLVQIDDSLKMSLDTLEIITQE